MKTDTFEYTGDMKESQPYYNKCRVKFMSVLDKKGDINPRLHKLTKMLTPVEERYLNRCYYIHKRSPVASMEDDKLAVMLGVTADYIRRIRLKLERNGYFERSVSKVNSKGYIFIIYTIKV